jgi:hypothetical protein
MELRLSRQAILLLSMITFSAVSHAVSWSAHSIKYGDWKNAESKCGDWLPSTETFDWGLHMRQSQKCKTKMTRDRIMMEKNSATGVVRERSRKPEYRILNQDKWQTTKGSLDRVLLIEKSDEWSGWAIIDDSIHSCEDAYPDGLSKNLDWGLSYIKPRLCNAFYERVKPVREIWLSGKTRRLEHLESLEKKQGPYVSVSLGMGTVDRWLKEQRTYSKWAAIGDVECTAPTQALSDAVGEEYLGAIGYIPVECLTPSSRTIYSYRVSLSGKRDDVFQDVEKQSLSSIVLVPRYGKRDQAVKEEWELSSDWTPFLDDAECVVGMNASWVEWGDVFTLVSSCEAQEKRSFALLRHFLSGSVSVVDSRDELRPADIITVSQQVGLRDALIASDVAERRSEWRDVGRSSCDGWFPQVNKVPLAIEYAQSRVCVQSQERYVEVMSKWSSGDKWIATEKVVRGLNTTQVRTNVGEMLARELLEPVVIEMTALGVGISEVFTMENAESFDRLRLVVEVDFEHDGLEVAMEADGVVIQPPSFNGSRRVFFFSLDDYKFTKHTQWKASVLTQGAPTGKVTFNFTLEQTKK